MPQRPKTPCKHPGCSRLVPYGAKYCDEHAPLHKERGSQEKGYTSRWRRARERFLHSHPLCVRCKEAGRIVPATVVDHIIPHRGDQTLFWDEGNWQPLCERCHNHKTMTEDRYESYTF